MNYEHDFEKPYELIAGKIVEMPLESFENVRAALYLLMLIAKEIGLRRVSNKAEIIISGRKVTSRVPDLTVFSESGATELDSRSRSTIDLDMLFPELVVEVVSPGKANHDRDYRYKRCSAVLRDSSSLKGYRKHIGGETVALRRFPPLSRNVIPQA